MNRHQQLSKFSIEYYLFCCQCAELLFVYFRCSLIALGNGTACRETEEWLTHLIKQGFFRPMNVKYTIVSEDGASIYSCSAEAKKEFPKLDTNIISAGI